MVLEVSISGAILGVDYFNQIAAIVRLQLIKRLVIYLSISSFGLTGCTEPFPGEPACRVEHTQNVPKIANAACIIRLNGQLLSIIHRSSGKYDLPGGSSNGKESAQCTAHRETWEETGFNVEVGKWLGQNDKGLQYYACKLAGKFDGTNTTFPVPEWATGEVTSIQLIDPDAITDKQWRFKGRIIQLRAMFIQVEDSKFIE
jgi:8-oxo-dGTP pyrophosphatase MutT (NUDIX family)